MEIQLYRDESIKSPGKPVRYVPPGWGQNTAASIELTASNEQIHYIAETLMFTAPPDLFGEKWSAFMAGQLIRSKFPSGWEDRPANKSLLEEFCNLYKEKENIIPFAQKHGPLGIGQDGLPGTHKFRAPNAEFLGVGEKMLIFSCHEMLSSWIFYSRGFALVLDLFRRLKDEEPILWDDCCILEEFFSGYPRRNWFRNNSSLGELLPPEANLQVIDLLQLTVDTIVRYADIRPSFSYLPKGVTLSINPLDHNQYRNFNEAWPSTEPSPFPINVKIKNYSIDDEKAIWVWPENNLYRVLAQQMFACLVAKDGVHGCQDCHGPYIRDSYDGPKKFCCACSTERAKENRRDYMRKKRRIEKEEKQREQNGQ
jgi:hypothetical protein